MKKIIAVLIAAILLITMFSGCSKSGGKQTDVSVNDADKQQISEQDIINIYNKLIESNEKPSKLLAYVDENINGLSVENASYMLGMFIAQTEDLEFQYNEEFYIENRQELMYKYFESGFEAENIKYIKEEDLKSFLDELINGSYKILTVEGSYMTIVDYEVLKKYSSIISDELRDYVEIMAAQSNKPTAMDAGLLIGWDEVVERILVIEDYLKKYKTSERRDIMLSIYSGYMMVYMSGMDNTPVFDFDTSLLRNEMLAQYKSAIEKHKNTVMGRIIQDYLMLLSEEAYMYTEKIQDYVIDINETVEKAFSK